MGEDLERNPLWLILIETVKNLPLYNHHKTYVYEYIFPENKEITPEVLAQRLDITLGESIVILYELKIED